MTALGHKRPAWAEIDSSRIGANVAALAALVAPAAVCAVVKADGYGHGATGAAQAALAGGATWLGVALAEEGVELRRSGVVAPLLVLSEPPEGAMQDVVAAGLRPTIYTRTGVEALSNAARGSLAPIPVHVKVDTGMHRVGAALHEVADIVDAVAADPRLTLEGLWTHLAVADEPASPTTAVQLDQFERVLADVTARHGRPPLVHAANSAGGLAHPASRYDLVRAGIAIYGYAPSAQLAGIAPLLPALSLRARASFVKRVGAGHRVSYGHIYVAARDTTVATIPLGYADGVPRRLSEVGAEVLVHGQRRPIAGRVTMDQLMVDCGDLPIEVGDEVVLIGEQDGQTITADDWANRLGTISYEVLCGIGPRVPRVWR